jgi:replicative DNA helicase
MAIPTGLIELDKCLGGGAYPGELILIGARAGVGKTTIAKTFANNIGKTQKVLYFTCEMPTQSLTDRDVAGYLGLPVDTIRYGNYDDYSQKLFGDITGPALEHVRNLNVYHVDGIINTDRIYRDCLQMKHLYGLDAVFVDYLGLLADRTAGNEYQRISYISRTLKQIAIELDVPLFSPVQLNREADKRENKRPQLSDLRDSGSLEQDADVIIFIYRESYYKQTFDNTTELILAKKRQGRGNIKVKCYFDEKHQRYCDLVKQDGLL